MRIKDMQQLSRKKAASLQSTEPEPRNSVMEASLSVFPHLINIFSEMSYFPPEVLFG